MSTYKGKIQKVRGKEITIDGIEPPLPGYRKQINAQATWENPKKGQQVRFGLSRKGNVNDLTLLDESGEIMPNPPDARFEAIPMEGQPPLTVRFTDQSTNNPTHWQWDFDDGAANSTDQNPSYTYQRLGNYTVRLTVSNAGGQSTPYVRPIRVTPPPPIEYHAAIVDPNANLNGSDWLHERTQRAIKYAKSENRNDKTEWQNWTLNNATSGIEQRKQALENNGFYQLVTCPEFHLDLLPIPSFVIAFQFTLFKPYITGGEDEIYLTQNSILIDHTFGMPTIRESAWKGHLRRAMRETLDRFQPKNKDCGDGDIINRLFGHRDPEADGAHQGDLHFYPTFFDQISLEVINPHDRSSRAGKNPILFEAVPEGTTGNFILLYTPILGTQRITDGLSHEERETIDRHNRQTITNAQNDLKEISKGIEAMMRRYGFSAKAGDGYGRAKDSIGKISNFPMLQSNSSEIPCVALSETLNDLVKAINLELENE